MESTTASLSHRRSDRVPHTAREHADRGPFGVPSAEPDLHTLVGSAMEGDRGSREALYHQYRGLATAVATRCTSNRHDQEDLVQEAFARAFSRLALLRDPDRFGPWLASIIKFAAIDRVRRDSRTVVTDALPERGCEADPYDSLPSTLAWLESAIQGALERLGERDAHLLRLIAGTGAGPGEIAQELGISYGAAKVALHRARCRLLHVLESDGIAWLPKAG